MAPWEISWDKWESTVTTGKYILERENTDTHGILTYFHRVYGCGVFETWTENDKCLVKITGFCTNEHPYVDKYNHNDIGCFDVSELQVSFNNTTQQ